MRSHPLFGVKVGEGAGRCEVSNCSPQTFCSAPQAYQSVLLEESIVEQLEVAVAPFCM